jgi:hypothetical protein
MNVPTGATWFDFFPAETGSQLQATVRPVNSIARQFFYRDSTVAAPVVFPPSTPHALGADAGVLRIANVGALTSNVEVVFWVR